MKKILTGCLFLCLLYSCKKDVAELPADTETGANTFGAKINGELWVPQGLGTIPANNLLESQLFPNGDLRIRARNFASSPNETEFDMFITGIIAPGTYLLNKNVSYPALSASFGYYVKRKLTPIDEWITSSTISGSVTITKLDVVNHIVSGTFQFNAASIYTPSQVLSVTDGRFDLKVKNVDDLYLGKNIKIMELNGASSEPGHIYDSSNNNIFKAYKDLFSHWRRLSDIAKVNIDNGHKPVPFKVIAKSYLKFVILKNKSASKDNTHLTVAYTKY